MTKPSLFLLAAVLAFASFNPRAHAQEGMLPDGTKVISVWSCDGTTHLEQVSRPSAGSSLPSTSSSSSVTLPNAPSTLPIIDGRHYRECRYGERFAEYSRDMFGYRPFVSAAFRAGVEQYRTSPDGWGQDGPGYAQRYGSAFGEEAIGITTRYVLAAAFHEDVRYLICHNCSAHDKIKNAVLAEFTARHSADGHRRFSFTPIAANFAGPLVAYSAWYPPGYDLGDAAKHSSLGFGTRIGGRVLREFILDRDTKPEKELKRRNALLLATPAP